MTMQKSTGVRLKVAVSFSVVLLTISAILGCAVRKPPQASHAFVDHRYVELQPGWRIRVVAPVLKSGGFKVQMEELKTNGNVMELKATDDLIGYEVDYYSVARRDRGGVSIRFKSAEVHFDGKRSTKGQPIVRLFEFGESVRFVRLLFLRRLSPTDHDAVILGASSLADLESLTGRVESNPAEGCKFTSEGMCSWVPQGVSVQPERRTAESGRKWVPAV